MSKLSKAIKAVTVLNEEEKVDLADFFKKEESKVEEKVEVKIEVKEEIVKEELKAEDKKMPDFLKLFETMSVKIENLTEKIEKSTPFGAKPKQLGKKDTSEFDDVFANLRSKQRS